MKTVLIILITVVVLFVLFKAIIFLYAYLSEQKEERQMERDNKAYELMREQQFDVLLREMQCFDELSEVEQLEIMQTEDASDILWNQESVYRVNKCGAIISQWISSKSLVGNKIKVSDWIYLLLSMELHVESIKKTLNATVISIYSSSSLLSEEDYKYSQTLLDRPWLSIEAMLNISKFEYSYFEMVGLTPICANDMAITQKCFLRSEGDIINLRQKDGERFYDMQNLLPTRVYLFKSSLELLNVEHRVVNYADILDIAVDREAEIQDGFVVLTIAIRNKPSIYLMCTMQTASKLIAIPPLLKHNEGSCIIVEDNNKKQVKAGRKVLSNTEKASSFEYVYLNPWVGDNYEKGFNGKRLMVLGVSHYASAEEWNPDFTNYIVDKCYLNPEYGNEGWKKTYVNFERALAGKEIYGEDKREVWDSIMFCNFIQEPMSNSKAQPTDEQIAIGQNAFVEIIEEYKPERIIVWGGNLYDWLPDKGYQGGAVSMRHPWKDGEKYKQDKVWVYPLLDNTLCEVMAVEPHPAAGFSWDYWHELISVFLKR